MSSPKLCASPATHRSEPIPATFSGPAFYGAKPAGRLGRLAASARLPPNVPILAPQHTSIQPQNCGAIGDPAPLTLLITIEQGNYLVTVAALLDSGSESSYFHPSLERLGVTRKRKRFQLKTLSMEGGAEAVDRVLVGFDILMASGQLIQIQAL